MFFLYSSKNIPIVETFFQKRFSLTMGSASNFKVKLGGVDFGAVASFLLDSFSVHSEIKLV